MTEEEEREFCKSNDNAIVTIYLLDDTTVKIRLVDSADYIEANRHLIKFRKFKPRRAVF